MTALLRFEGVALIRGGRLLFEDLSFALTPGEALQVRGPNGTGKSSLLRLAAGLLAQNVGQIERSPLALADDRVALDREVPLGRALTFWGKQTTPALHSLGIGHLADVPVRFLSTGQLKRATLARVISAQVPLWLLDEPLNGLDNEGERRLGPLLEAHRESGGAVIAASHQQLPGEWQSLDLEK